MPRDITAAFLTEINAGRLFPALLARLYFDAGTEYVWTGTRPLVWNGNTYQGLGGFVGISKIEESQLVKANGMTLVLSGIPQSRISESLSEPYTNRRFEIDLAVLDTSGAVIPSPYTLYAGFMDVMEGTENGDNSSIALSVENELLTLFKPTFSVYTNEDQHKLYPADDGFEFVPFLQDKEVVFKEKA